MRTHIRDLANGRPFALCQGEVSDPLFALLHDVFGELNVDLHATSLPKREPVLVLVAVDSSDPRPLVAESRQLAGNAPVIALLPIDDERIAAQAISAGADACFPLGTPLTNLRLAFLRCLLHSSAEI
jgi:hypothetical protein